MYFDILKLKPPKRYLSKSAVKLEEEEELEEEQPKAEEGGKVSKALKSFLDFAMELLDDVNDWLEDISALYREVVEAVQARTRSQEQSPEPDTVCSTPTTTTRSVASDMEAVGVQDTGSAVVTFDQRGGLLEKHLHLEPTAQQQRETEAYEAELKDRASQYTRRFKRLGKALYYVFLSSNSYIPFFFIIVSIIINGSLLSLVYAFLLFGWGLLSVPWPSKRFWLTLIFYTMFVLVVKYCFQFEDISYWHKFDPNSGLYIPRIIGIEKQSNFVSNAVVDVLLLVFLLIHRGLLFVRKMHAVQYNQYFSLMFNEVVLIDRCVIRVLRTYVLYKVVTKGILSHTFSNMDCGEVAFHSRLPRLGELGVK